MYIHMIYIYIYIYIYPIASIIKDICRILSFDPTLWVYT